MSDLKAPESQFNSGSLGFVFHRNLSSQARESLGLLFFQEHPPSSPPPCIPPWRTEFLCSRGDEARDNCCGNGGGSRNLARGARSPPHPDRHAQLPHSAPTHSPTAALGLALLKWCQTRKKHLRKARVSVSSFYFYLQQNRWLYSSIFRDS